jgi:hypothetical protein
MKILKETKHNYKGYPKEIFEKLLDAKEFIDEYLILEDEKNNTCESA